MSVMTMLRHWREGFIGALAIGLCMLWVGKSASDRELAIVRMKLSEATHAIETEREEVRRRTRDAQAADAAHAAVVEARQTEISKETGSAYKKQIDDLRQRYDALRLRGSATAVAAGDRGSAGMPGVSDAAGGTDDPARQDGLPAADALTASEQALRLQALQAWVTKQDQVPR